MPTCAHPRGEAQGLGGRLADSRAGKSLETLVDPESGGDLTSPTFPPGKSPTVVRSCPDAGTLGSEEWHSPIHLFVCSFLLIVIIGSPIEYLAEHSTQHMSSYFIP